MTLKPGIITTAAAGINDILKDMKLEKVVLNCNDISTILYFLLNKCSLDEQNAFTITFDQLA